MLGRRFASVAALSALALSTAPVAAFAAPATSQHDQVNYVESEDSVNPCTGAAGSETTTAHGAFHKTVNADGSEHDAISIEGGIDFTPADPTAVEYTGHFSLVYNENDAPNTSVVSAPIHIEAMGTDGSSLSYRAVAHVLQNAAGTTLSFSDETMTCR